MHMVKTSLFSLFFALIFCQSAVSFTGTLYQTAQDTGDRLTCLGEIEFSSLSELGNKSTISVNTSGINIFLAFY